MNKIALALMGAVLSFGAAAQAPAVAPATGTFASLSAITAAQFAIILVPVALAVGVTVAAENGNDTPSAPVATSSTATAR